MESLAKVHQSTCPSDWLKDHPGAEEGNQEASPEEELLSAECEPVNTPTPTSFLAKLIPAAILVLTTRGLATDIRNM